MTLGTAVLDSMGNATLAGATVPEGIVTIVATTDNLPVFGVGTGSVTVRVDLNAPMVVTNLAAAVLDRRQTSMQLSWTAPADVGGGSVTDYQIRYAKVPIDASNFDNPAVATPVPFGGTPGSPGSSQTITVSNLYIENGYYFAVAAIDGVGNRGAVVSSAAPGSGQTCDCMGGRCCAARFLTTMLTGASGTEGLGISVDGSGDANGDTTSDLLVGSLNGSRAGLYFGGTSFAAGSPSVLFTGANASFGRSVAFIGDIDNDGREDLAIAATSLNTVYIFRGRMTWPMTLADTNADFTVTTDASYASSSFGSSIARLGDFNGDSIDDVAIGSPNFGGSGVLRGRVTIILGATGFTSVAVPDAARAIVVVADPALNATFFGSRVVGLGHFYGGSGTTMVVSAPGFVSGTVMSANEGRLYAFRGQAGTGGVINATAADAIMVGAAAQMRIGTTLANLGPINGALPAVGAGNVNDIMNPGMAGSSYVLSGTAGTGPFINNKIFYLSNNGLIGTTIMGGGISGRDLSVSLIGATGADLVVIGRNGTDFAIIDGSKIPPLPSPSDARMVGDVIVPFPTGFGALSTAAGTLIPDINGDQYPDIALGASSPSVAGQVAVIW
jgi:hypothetical protein